MNTDNVNLLQELFENENSNSSLSSINSVTEKIIGCSYTVSNKLGCGFLEKVYENALSHELRKAGLNVSQQHLVKVFYDGVIVGDYVADLFVESRVIVEIKAIKSLEELHLSQ